MSNLFEQRWDYARRSPTHWHPDFGSVIYTAIELAGEVIGVVVDMAGQVVAAYSENAEEYWRAEA